VRCEAEDPWRRSHPYGVDGHVEELPIAKVPSPRGGGSGMARYGAIL
jgi:hypothetical protein